MRTVCPWQPFSPDSSSLLINRSLSSCLKCGTINQESWIRSSALLRKGLLQHGCLHTTTAAQDGHCPSPPASCRKLKRLFNHHPQTFLQILTISSPSYHYYLPQCLSTYRVSQTKIHRSLSVLFLDPNVSPSYCWKVSLFLISLTSSAGQKADAWGSAGWAVEKTSRNRHPIFLRLTS